MKTTRQVKRDAHELWQVCLQDGVLDETRTRLVVEQIAGLQRASAVPLLRQFLRLVRLDRAGRSAVVTSATPLDPAVRAEIERGLAQMDGRLIDTTFVGDPGVVGGARTPTWAPGCGG